MLDNRNDLAAELKRRLLLDFTVQGYFEGDAGIWGKWDRELPCLHVYELTSEKEMIKPGIYQVLLPIQVEWVGRLADSRQLYTYGKDRLKSLQTAIEIDERFKKNKGLVEEGQDLVVKYSMVADEVQEVLPGIIDVGVLYHFNYIEKFLGYETSRH